ncbi:MAG: hypothetical protein ACREEE_12410 [Dongiaceae bacterium]
MLSVAAALLNRSCSIDRLSRLMTIGALFMLTGIGALGVPDPVLVFALALSMLVGFICLYFSVRVAFDATLFRQLAAAKDRAIDLPSLDTALVELGLQPANKAGRTVRVRIAGARQLFHRQIYAAFIQFILALAGAIYVILT